MYSIYQIFINKTDLLCSQSNYINYVVFIDYLCYPDTLYRSCIHIEYRYTSIHHRYDTICDMPLICMLTRHIWICKNFALCLKPIFYQLRLKTLSYCTRLSYVIYISNYGNTVSCLIRYRICIHTIYVFINFPNAHNYQYVGIMDAIIVHCRG